MSGNVKGLSSLPWEHFPLPHQQRQLFGGHGAAKVKTLHQTAAVLQQKVALLRLLHPFGNDFLFQAGGNATMARMMAASSSLRGNSRTKLWSILIRLNGKRLR